MTYADTISERLALTHAAGCGVPGYVSALPMATMMGRNPWIEEVADGEGGTLFRCGSCGALQGQGAPAAPRITKRRHAGGPPAGDGLTITQIRDGLVAWRRDRAPGEWPPSQEAFSYAGLRAGKVSDRRLRQVISAAGSRWEDELRAAETGT